MRHNLVRAGRARSVDDASRGGDVVQVLSGDGKTVYAYGYEFLYPHKIRPVAEHLQEDSP